jgi:hypothetical protein
VFVCNELIATYFPRLCTIGLPPSQLSRTVVLGLRLPWAVVTYRPLIALRFWGPELPLLPELSRTVVRGLARPWAEVTNRPLIALR